MRPSDLLAASDFAVGTLRTVADRDWSVQAGSLDWDVSFTIAHVAGAITKYTTYLAAEATRWSPLIVSGDPRATNDQLLDGVDISARGLAFVASHADVAARGFHPWGMSDASASLARAANEVLVHGWDAATGLDVAFDPPPSVCSPVLRRRHPWVDADNEPWPTLLAANGRTGGPNWIPLEMPLDQWDGSPPSGGPQPPAIAWRWEAETSRWTPTYP